MRFEATPLEGVWIVHAVKHVDERGFFARTWCTKEFSGLGLKSNLAQCNVSFNLKTGTVRGMHFQEEPHAEAKIVRCTTGAILDVVVDLRPESATFLQHLTISLEAAAHTAVYIPEGFAHGFQTLQDSCEVLYQMSTPFHPQSSRGVRWDDPLLRITWPLPITAISEKDLSFPDLVCSGDLM